MATAAHGTAHGHLFVQVESAVHRLAPEAKLAGLVAFVVAVAITPRTEMVAFAVDAAVLLAAFATSRLPVAVLARAVVIVPFVAFALLVPFVADGRSIDVLGVALSVDGLWASWNIVVKAWFGATACILLSATTPIPDVRHGLSRLRVPRVMVAIAAFMFRYLDLLTEQLRRMRAAMTARCHDPRWLWQARPIASSAGVLFVRSYERGERIHQAMLARGFTGTMPELDTRCAAKGDWRAALAPGATALVVLVIAVAR
jgi:cobalt/nickel transport system permease protein